jgi:hypothetical protein
VVPVQGMCYRCREQRETAVIYCVVPPELGEDAFRRLVEHYRDNPNVKVILDRRHGERRGDSSGGGARKDRDGRRRLANYDV